MPNWSESGSAPIMVAPFALEVLSLDWVQVGPVAASDTDYWTFELRRHRGGGAGVTVATKTTRLSGGAAIVPDTGWTFDMVAFSADRLCQKHDVLKLAVTRAGNPEALSTNSVTVRYAPL